MAALTAGGLRRARTLRLESAGVRVDLRKEFRWSMLAGALLLNAGIWISIVLPGRHVVSPVLQFVGIAVMLVSLERLP
jgi:hypothetical protein